MAAKKVMSDYNYGVKMKSKTTVSWTTINRFLFASISILMLSGIKGFANYASFAILIVLLLLNIKSSLTKEQICVYYFLLFYVFSSLPQLDVNYCLKYTIYYLLVFSPVIYYSFVTQKNMGKDVFKNELLVFTFIWLAVSVISIIFYINDPGAARNLAQDGDAYSGSIIGGYSLSYGSALLCTYLFGIIIDMEEDKKTRAISTIVCIILAALVYLTESTLTTFAMLTGIVVTVVFERRASGINKYIRFIFCLLLISIVLLITYIEIHRNVYLIINWLNSQSDILIFRRIREVVNSVFLGINSRHFNERTGLITQSIELFFKSPLVGNGYKYGNVFSAGKIYGIGNHSELFDSFAKYGLLGFFPLLYVYICGVKRIATNHLGVIVCFVMLVIFNPFISFASNLALFVIIPLINQYTQLNREINTQECFNE